jgi:hypothetical protein
MITIGAVAEPVRLWNFNPKTLVDNIFIVSPPDGIAPKVVGYILLDVEGLIVKTVANEPLPKQQIHTKTNKCFSFFDK